jgi:ferrochelatase
VSRIAIVLFSLGGPDRPESVRPFLFNLFNDPAIIGAPQPVRWALARLISGRRAPVARKIYEQMGGSSPLLANTVAQGEALAEALADLGEVRIFPAMRYWHPLSEEVAAEVKAFAPERIVLLPLYPQFSTTTTRSSLAEWRRAARSVKLESTVHGLCCYPTETGFVGATAGLIRRALRRIGCGGRPRVLFSAHGLPKKVVAKGDPYQWQVEQTVAAVVDALDGEVFEPVICYQSKVGPLEWIGPATDAEIERAGRDGVPVIIVPIAFVSEHSETLVELDIEYCHLAEAAGVPAYERVPTVGTEPPFIAGLSALVRRALDSEAPLCSGDGGRICPDGFAACPLMARA